MALRNRKKYLAFPLMAGICLLAVCVSAWLFASWAIERGSRTSSPMRRQLQCGQWAVIRTCQLRGVPITASKVNELLPYHRNGHTLLQVAEALRALGFDTEARSASIEALEAHECPCIVHLTSPDHFIVVCAVESDCVHVYDGAGRRTVRTKKALEPRLGGAVLHVWRGSGRVPIGSLSRSGVDKPGPIASFETLLMDKGTVAASGKSVAFVYPFQNVGSANLVIEKVQTDCKCLRAESPQEPIPPSGTGEVTLYYNIKPERGPFLHKALVETNDSQNPTFVLEAAGYTGTDVSIHPPRLNLGEVVRGRERTARVFVSYVGDREDFDVIDARTSVVGASASKLSQRLLRHAEEQRVAVDLPEEIILHDNVRVVEMSLTPMLKEREKLEGELTIRTNVEGFGRMSVPVKGIVVCPVKAYPSILNFGSVPSPAVEEQTFTLVSLTREPFRIVAVDSPAPELDCSYPDSLIHFEAEVVVRPTIACLQELRKTGLRVHIELPDSKEELTIPLEVLSGEEALADNG